MTILQLVKELKLQTFRDVKPCRLASKDTRQSFLGRLDLKDERKTIRRNVCHSLLLDTAYNCRRLVSTAAALPETQTTRSQEFPCHFIIHKDHYRVQISSPPDLILSHKNLAHITIPYGRLASISHFQDKCHIKRTNLM